MSNAKILVKCKKLPPTILADKFSSTAYQQSNHTVDEDQSVHLFNEFGVEALEHMFIVSETMNHTPAPDILKKKSSL